MYLFIYFILSIYLSIYIYIYIYIYIWKMLLLALNILIPSSCPIVKATLYVIFLKGMKLRCHISFFCLPLFAKVSLTDSHQLILDINLCFYLTGMNIPIHGRWIIYLSIYLSIFIPYLFCLALFIIVQSIYLSIYLRIYSVYLYLCL